MSVTLLKRFRHDFPPKFKEIKLLDSTDFKFPTLKGLKAFAEALKSLCCSPLQQLILHDWLVNIANLPAAFTLIFTFYYLMVVLFISQTDHF